MTTRTRKPKKIPRDYVIESNRAIWDNIRRVQQHLERRGIDTDRLRHKTALKITRPASMSWKEFKAILCALVQKRIGQLIVFSCTTGRVFCCDNTGNQPGTLQRIA